MKVVKLNRRFKQFNRYGHSIALRFDFWMSTECLAYEYAAEKKLGGSGYDRSGPWCSYFGDRVRTITTDHRRNLAARSYWISFRNEADLTLVLLSVDLTK